MFVFVVWHKIEKFSGQKFIGTFISSVIQLLQEVATQATPNIVEVVEKKRRSARLRSYRVPLAKVNVVAL